MTWKARIYTQAHQISQKVNYYWEEINIISVQHQLAYVQWLWSKSYYQQFDHYSLMIALQQEML